MNFDLKNKLETIELPIKIGEYEFARVFDPGDGALSISYQYMHSSSITITIYNNDKTLISDDISDERVIQEFNDCIDVVFYMEDEGEYTNVELLSKQVCDFVVDEECDFHLAAFSFYHMPNNIEQKEERIFSLLFLRTDGGYFHKIRHSQSDMDENILDKLEVFLTEWKIFIKNNSLNIN